MKTFTELFPEIALPAGIDTVHIDNMALYERERFLEIKVSGLTEKLPAIWQINTENAIRDKFGLQAVVLKFPERPKEIPNEVLIPGKHGGTVFLDEIIEEKKCTVTGKVLALMPKLYERFKTRIWFDIADEQAACRAEVTVPGAEAKKIYDRLSKAVKGEEWVKVTGKLMFRHVKEEYIFEAESVSFAKAPEGRVDEAPEKRVELHLHTKMSAKDGLCDIKKVIKTAEAWGHSAVAITDHGVCHSFPEAMMAAKGTSVKVIYGCEGYMPAVGGKNYHIILLSKNRAGLTDLYRLVSLSHIEHFKKRPMIPKDLLSMYRENLIIGSACEAGEVYRAVLAKKPREELLEIAKYYDYLEIQPLCNNQFMIREKIVENREELMEINKTIISLARELKIPFCATGDVHFLNPEDELYRKVLTHGMFADSGEDLPLYFKTTNEMLEAFSYLGEETAFEAVVKNPQYIASLCEKTEPVLSGEFPPSLEGSAEELRRLTETKAHELYGDILPEILQTRIDTELNSIIKKGYDVIYMISQKLVERSLREGYLVGSRGSVGSSIVAFLSGITEVNALPAHYRCGKCKHYEFSAPPLAACGADLPDKPCPICGESLIKDGFDIPFATFLGFEADKKPDIDLNFSGEYQARAHAHTIELFGESKVFRAGTISTLAEKNTIGYALKYLNDNRSNPAELTRHSIGLVGIKSTTGQHPGGLVILPEGREIYEFCPVQYPADKSDNMITTHFDYHAIEENLLKLDLLGHDDPTILRMLQDLTGINAQSIPLDDPDTMSIFSSSSVLGYENDKLLGKTGAVAVPEFGTRFVRGMLLSTLPNTFDELIRISGLSHGTDVWLGNAETLIAEGKATLKEVICARDDIMIYLISKGLERKLSFTIMESVRKGKGLKPEWEEEMRKYDVPGWYIDSCNKIKYMFPKAHAAAYVVMAFRVAWYKVHRPLAFYAAYFSIRAVKFDYNNCCLGIETALKHIKRIDDDKEASAADKDQLITLEVCYEFYKRGFSFAPLDIFKCDAERFIPLTDGRLLPPLVSVPGLGEAAANDIVREREISSFDSIEDIERRCRVNKTHMEQLRILGAFGDLPESPQISLW